MEKLGKSVFNYQDYSPDRFVHYLQQIQCVLKLKLKKVLEIGPGDHTVTDFLRRKGVSVKTFDNDPKLHPDYSGDIRKPLKISEKFDVVLASEVFEHMDVSWLETILQNLKQVIAKKGHLVVSLPYSTIRLFPPTGNYGKIVSCEGIIKTRIPIYFIQPILTLIRGVYRILTGKNSPFEYFVIPKYPDNKFDIHHWDLGWHPTTRRAIRKIFAKHFQLIEEKAHVNTNSTFFILKKK